MSISGFRPIEGPDASGVEDAGAPVGDAPAPEGQIVRHAIAPRLAPMVATLDAKVLQDQLVAEGQTKTEAKAEAKKIVSTAGEIEDLKAELADMQELEKMYEEMLADPDLDSWDAAWLEWDLWDLRAEIYDVQQQLGELQGSFEELIGQAWGALANIFGLTAELNKLESQKIDDSGKRIAEDIDRARRLKEQTTKLDRENQKRLTELREKGILPPTPPASEALRVQMARVRAKVESGVKTREKFEEVRKLVKEVRTAKRA